MAIVKSPKPNTEAVARNRIPRFFLDRPSVNLSAQKNLLLCAALVLLPHLFQQRALILTYCIALLSWQVLIAHEKLKPTTRLTRLLLTLMSFALIFTQPASMMSQNAGVELLLMMLFLKLFEAHAGRDVTVTYGLCLFVLLTAFLYNSSIVMWAYSLVAIYALLHSMKRTGSRQRLSMHNLLPDKSLLGLMLRALPIAAIIFIVIPRPSGPLWGIPAHSGMAKTGLTEQMSPGEIGQLSDNDSIAFRVTFKGDAPAPKDMYWRGPIFTFYNGHTWSEPDFIAKNDRFNQPTKLALPPQHSDTKRYDYQVLLNPHNHKWLFTLNSNDAAPAHTHYSPVGQLLAQRPITTTFIYTVNPSRPRLERDEIEPFTRHYLRLPNRFGHKTRHLIEQLKMRTDKTRAYDVQMVQQVLNYFQENNFIYTRKPPLLARYPVDQFLFDTRAGFCEHYASAFTFMMRAAGIPARIVTGYQGAEYNPAQDYYIVRQSNAHAWTEVWLQNKGWTRVDPTTVIPPSRIDRSSIAEKQNQDAKQLKNGYLLSHPLDMIGYYFDAIDYQWDLHVVGFDTQSQSRLFQQLQTRTALLTLLIVAVLAILVFTIIKWRTTVPRDPANHYYQLFCAKLSRRGYQKAAHETPNDFALRVVRERPQWKILVDNITALYLQLRYSKVPPNNTIDRLRQHVKSLKV